MCAPALCCLQSLKSMGITAAFDDKQADFSRISQDPLMLTTVMQSVSQQCSLLCMLGA